MAEPSSRLYVGNLPYVAQETDISSLFADNGITITKIEISIDPFTGRNPSYCFVELESPEHAAAAKEALEGKGIRGRPVKINFKTERRQPTSRLPTKSYDSGWRPRESTTTNVKSEEAFVFDRWNRTDARSHWTQPLEEKRRLYVGGLARIPNQDAVNSMIKELFTGYNIQAVGKLVSPHPSKYSQPGSHYYCFVDFSTAEEAAAAMAQLDNTETPHGGQYRIKIAHFSKPTTVEKEQLGVPNTRREPFADSRKAKSPPRQRNLEGSWRRQD